MARGLLILRHSVVPASPPRIACAPASAPAPVPASGDQDWPAASNKANQRLTVLALAIASVLAIVFLLLIYYVVLLRHRSSLRRRRRRRLIRSLTGTDPPDGDGDAVNHHAWHIRTVGLNQEAIEAIPVVEFGEEWKGAVDDCDCAVCLSEFDQGELLRMLPKCGHAFHVECIDTWLQSHVNCPLCRAPVVPPPATPAPGDDDGAFPESSEAGGSYSTSPEATGDLEEAASQIGHRPTSPSAVKVSTEGAESLSGTGESSARGSSRGNAPDPPLSDLEGYDSEGSQLPNDGHQSSPSTLSYSRASVPVHRSISVDSTLSATSLPTVELCGSSDSKELTLGNQMLVSSEEKQDTDSKGTSEDKNSTEMARSLSSGGGNFLLSRFGRGRTSSILPL